MGMVSFSDVSSHLHTHFQGKLVPSNLISSKCILRFGKPVRKSLGYNLHCYDNCHLLSHCLCTLVACIVNNMDPDQTAPLGAV